MISIPSALILFIIICLLLPPRKCHVIIIIPEYELGLPEPSCFRGSICMVHSQACTKYIHKYNMLYFTVINA